MLFLVPSFFAAPKVRGNKSLKLIKNDEIFHVDYDRKIRRFFSRTHKKPNAMACLVNLLR